jgi:hypothetical protein
MAQEDKIKRNILIIQYITHIETLRLDDAATDKAIQAAFLNSSDMVLSIMLNGEIIYTKAR